MSYVRMSPAERRKLKRLLIHAGELFQRFSGGQRAVAILGYLEASASVEVGKVDPDIQRAVWGKA